MRTQTSRDFGWTLEEYLISEGVREDEIMPLSPFLFLSSASQYFSLGAPTNILLPPVKARLLIKYSGHGMKGSEEVEALSKGRNNYFKEQALQCSVV